MIMIVVDAAAAGLFIAVINMKMIH